MHNKLASENQISFNLIQTSLTNYSSTKYNAHLDPDPLAIHRDNIVLHQTDRPRVRFSEAPGEKRSRWRRRREKSSSSGAGNGEVLPYLRIRRNKSRQRAKGRKARATRINLLISVVGLFGGAGCLHRQAFGRVYEVCMSDRYVFSGKCSV